MLKKSITDRIRKLCDLLDKDDVKIFKSPKTEYITIRLDSKTRKTIVDMACKDDKAVSAVCRELIIKALEK